MNFLKNKWFKLFFTPSLRWHLLGIFACLGISSYLGKMTPQVMKGVFDSFSQKEFFFQNFKSLFFLIIGEYGLSLIYQILIIYYVQKIIFYLRKHCFEVWIYSRKWDEYPLGEVLARMVSDTEAVRELISSGSFSIIIDLVFIVSCLLSFITIHPIAGWSLIIMEITVLFGLIYLTKIMAKTFMKVRVENGLLSRSMADVLGGLTQSYYMNSHHYTSQRVKKNLDNYLQVQLRSNIWDAGHYSLAESIFPLFLSAFGIMLRLIQTFSASTLGALIDLTQRSIAPIKEMASKVSSFQRAYTGFQRIQQFLTQLEGEKRSSHIHEQKISALEIKVPFFQYPGADFALHDIHLNFKVPSLIGIVGSSGQGKSTLFNLIAGNIPLPKDASLHVFSKNADIYSLVGLVTQDSHIFSANLSFNLSFMPTPTPELQIFWHEVCQSIEYLDVWKINLESEIRVNELSMGQKQLICALRACFLKRPIILFDEISSGLDSKLEEALRKIIMKVQKEAITLVITHRLETIIEADKILVMEKGRVVDEGSHQYLLSESKIYRKFVDEISSLSYNS